MDVALRATLKEFGFKRKSRINYVCQHSPDRVWVFEIKPSRGPSAFRDWSSIFVPKIKDLITRIVPEVETYGTSKHTPAHFKTSIAELIRIERGWDEATWEKNPKSQHWIFGPRFPPSVDRVIPLFDGHWWDPYHTQEVLDRSRSIQGKISRKIETASHEQRLRDWQEAAHAVGREMDTLWREHATDWLQKCDDPNYLARWFDKFVFSGKDTPVRSAYAATAAIAYYVAGNNDGAANILARFIAESTTTFEAELARLQAVEHKPGPLLELVLRSTIGPQAPRIPDAAVSARAAINNKRNNIETARKLADSLGLKL